VNVLRAVLDDDHSTRGKWFCQRRIGNNLRRGFAARERDNMGESAVIRYALCSGTNREQAGGRDH
jgi:hypothetical protein